MCTSRSTRTEGCSIAYAKASSCIFSGRLCKWLAGSVPAPEWPVVDAFFPKFLGGPIDGLAPVFLALHLPHSFRLATFTSLI